MCFLFKLVFSFPYVNSRAGISARAEICPCNQPLNVCMGTDFNTSSISSNISYKSFKTLNLPKQNCYCDQRNFDGVNQQLKEK